MREVTASENPTVDPTQQGVAIKILVPDSQGTAPSCCWVFSIHCRGVQHPFSAPALLLSFRAFGTHVRLPFFTPFVLVVFRVSYHNSWCHHRQERREDQRNSRRESSFGTSADLLHIAGARKRTVCDRQSCRCVDCVYGHPADVGSSSIRQQTRKSTSGKNVCSSRQRGRVPFLAPQKRARKRCSTSRARCCRLRRRGRRIRTSQAQPPWAREAWEVAVAADLKVCKQWPCHCSMLANIFGVR